LCVVPSNPWHFERLAVPCCYPVDGVVNIPPSSTEDHTAGTKCHGRHWGGPL